MFKEFRTRYPNGSLISELVRIDHGKYIVKATIEIEGRILATGLAAADTIETAEDRARERALALLDFNIPTTASSPEITLTETNRESIPTATVTPKKSPKPPKAETLTEPAPEPIKIVVPIPLPEPPRVEKLPDLELEPEPEPEPEPLVLETEDDNYSLFNDEVIRTMEDEPEEKPEPIPLITVPTEEIDYSILKTKIDAEMKRLGWTTEKGRDYLISTYGKKSRLLLTNEELVEFYNYVSTL